jgi:hypothetical protein
MVLVPVPKATAAGILRMVADTMPFEVPFHVLVSDLRLQVLDIQRRRFFVDAGCALLPLNFKHT